MNKIEYTLQNYIKYIAKLNNLPSLSVSIKDCDFDFNYSYSTNNQVQSHYSISSQTKIYTSILINRLAELELLNINDKIINLIPELNQCKHLDHITIQSLLTHKSGLIVDTLENLWNNKNNFPKNDEVLKLLNGADCINKSTINNFSYSNLGYAVLGIVVENELKISYFQALKKYVLLPLCLDDTLLDNEFDKRLDKYHADVLDKINNKVKHDCSKSFESAIGLISNPSELVKMIDSVFNKKKLLKNRTRKDMLKTQSEGKYTKYGYGFFINKEGRRKLYGHSGGSVGSNSNIIFDKHGVIVCYMTNVTSGFSITYSKQIYKLYLFLKEMFSSNNAICPVDGWYNSNWSDMFVLKNNDELIFIDFYSKKMVDFIYKYYLNNEGVYLPKTIPDRNYYGYKIVNNKLVGEKYDMWWKQEI